MQILQGIFCELSFCVYSNVYSFQTSFGKYHIQMVSASNEQSHNVVSASVCIKIHDHIDHMQLILSKINHQNECCEYFSNAPIGFHAGRMFFHKFHIYEFFSFCLDVLAHWLGQRIE